MKAEWELAAREGDARGLAALLAAGADVDARDSHGQTALMLAAHAGHLEAVRTLVAAGAELDVAGKFGLTAMMLAVVGAHPSVAELLASAGADLRARGTGAPGFAGKTASALAHDQGLHELAAKLAFDESSP